MGKWFWFAVLVILAMLIQSAMLSNLVFKPDLLLIMLVFFAVRFSTFDAVITSFVLGLASDLIGTSPVGAGAAAFGAAGVILAYLQRSVSLRSPVFAGAAIFFAGLFAGTTIYLLSVLKTGSAGNLANSALWTSLYSAVAGPFLLPALKWFADLQSKPQRRY